MDIKTVKKFIDLVNDNNLAEIAVSNKQESIHIVSSRKQASFIPQEPVVVAKTQPAEVVAPQEEAIQLKYAVNSPMVGTVYLAATPGAKHFVEIGQKVKQGDTLCLIEAMKMYNKIEADRDGVVMTILVENAQAVEYNQPLFIVE